MAFTETLRFQYSNLPREGNLVFTFDDQQVESGKIYQDFFPVAWHVVKLSTGGEFMFDLTYRKRFTFTTSQIVEGVLRDSSVVDINFKQETTLTEDGDVPRWSEPKTNSFIANDQFAMKNEVGMSQGISVGIKAYGCFPRSILFIETRNGKTYRVKPTPRLRIYEVKKMKGGAIIKSEIPSPRLWDHDLNEPGLPNNWFIKYDEANGRFEIVPE